MRVGLDIHGVIDSDPVRFLEFAREVKKGCGNDVFIITGPPVNDDLLDELAKFGFIKGIDFDVVLSIQDELEKSNVPVTGLDKHGRNHYDDEQWDSCKAKICERYDIDVHIDDTLRYMFYFKGSTIFGHYVYGEIKYYL